MTWGDAAGDSSAVAAQLVGVEYIYSAQQAFAALKSDGTVVTWGSSVYGGNSSAVAAQRINVISAADVGSNGGGASSLTEAPHGTSATQFITVTITGTNDAPTITSGNVYNFTATDEDTSSVAVTASTILANASHADVDSGAVAGMAITSLSGTGSWQYSTDGSTWTNISGVAADNALLVTAATQLRYVPDGQNGTPGSFTYRAWDQTSGTASDNSTPSFGDASAGGTTTAYSTSLATASITVTSVNDAPVLDNSGDMTLTTITEDETTNSGNTVASIIASAGGDRITDVDTGAVEGIAITSLTSGNGTWQFSTNSGSTWTNIGIVADNSALLLRSTDLVRFVPNAENATTADITFRAWDQTVGTAGTKVNASTHGGTTAFSTDTDVATILVTDVNDAPVIDTGANFVLNTIAEDVTTGANTGTTVNELIASAGLGAITDPDGGAVQGIAVTGVDNSNGIWFFSTDGISWSSLSWRGVSTDGANDAAAVLLDPTARLRFEPNADYNGTSSITFRAWDQTSGSNGQWGVNVSSNAGTTAFSADSATAELTITPVNDAPDFLGQTVINNGSFDSDLSGWTTSGNVGFAAGEVRFGGFGGGIDGVISQTFNTVVGQTYYVTFDYGDRSATQSQSVQLVVTGFGQRINSTIESGVADNGLTS